jgi:hypothetical protein
MIASRYSRVVFLIRYCSDMRLAFPKKRREEKAQPPVSVQPPAAFCVNAFRSLRPPQPSHHTAHG